MKAAGWRTGLLILVGVTAWGASHAEVIRVSPDQNLDAAVARLRAGDTLLLSAGVYRQTLLLNGKRGGLAEPITIEGVGDATIIRGSDVLKRWTPLGNDLYSHPLKEESSMVFVNGNALQQIGGTLYDGYPLNPQSDYRDLHKSEGGIWLGRVPDVKRPQELPPESFWYDATLKTLYVRSRQDLQQALVEASQRTRAVEAEGVGNMVFRKFRVQHANTAVRGRGAAMTVRGDNLVIEQITADWNDAIGLGTNGTQVRVSDVRVAYNGQLGMSGQGYKHHIERVTAVHNNRRKFNKWWEAGGFKFIGNGGLRDSVFEHCVALHNLGDGIWFDWKNRNVDIRRNLSAYNTGFGIHFEASGPGLIQHNVSVGNGQRGIYLSASHQTQVRHNLIIGNGLQGIASALEDRADENGVKFTAKGNRFHRNVIAWNKEGALFIPEDDAERSNHNVFLGRERHMMFSVEFPSLTRPSRQGLTEWNQQTGQDTRSWSWDVPMPATWSAYLNKQSTDMAPLARLLQDVRRTPPADQSTLGSENRALKLRVPIEDAGPDWVR
jgi:parallel beta-helix repeat protein